MVYSNLNQIFSSCSSGPLQWALPLFTATGITAPLWTLSQFLVIYFSASPTKPKDMSDWRPVYVVGDGKKKPFEKPEAKPPKKPRKRRRWGRKILGWITLILVLFGSGLTLGLIEDNEAEEYLEDQRLAAFSDLLGGPNQHLEGHEEEQLAAQGFRGAPGNSHINSKEDTSYPPTSPHLIPSPIFHRSWKDIAMKFRWIRTGHFECRRACRDISWKQVIETIWHGEKTKTERGFDHDTQRETLKYTIKNLQSARQIGLTFTISQDLKTIKLITIFDKDKDRWTCPDSCNGPKAAFSKWRNQR